MPSNSASWLAPTSPRSTAIDISEGTGTRTGFVGGIFLGAPGRRRELVIEPEVLYSKQGATYDNEFFDGTYAVDYVRIPVLVKWAANPGGKGFYVMLGPSVGINVSCNDSGTYKPTDTDYEGSCEDEGDIKAKIVFSGDLGGYASGQFGLEGRYGFDWGDAFEVVDGGEGIDAKNSVISVMLRWTK